MSTKSSDMLIAAMADDLEPVRPMRPRVGLAMAGGAFVATGLAVVFLAGPPTPFVTGQVSSLYLLANGLLFLLGLAAGMSAIAMASPRVGARHDGTRWAVAMAAVLPLAALVSILGHWLEGQGGFPSGLHCAVSGTVASLLVAVALVAWLRRGAPVSPERAGMHAGIAAGAFGTVAYGIACPVVTIGHIGVWHVLPVAVAGLAGRLIVPRLLRW